MLGGGGANRTVTLTPATDQTGLATVTLTVSDGINTASTSFVLTVKPLLPAQLCDAFSYSDGPIVGALPNSPWEHHSGTVQEALVANGRLQLSQSLTEDINAPLLNAPHEVTSGAVLYAGFTVNFHELPAGEGGTYFAHFKDDGTINFRCRVFASTTNAPPGMFRLGVGNSSAATALSGQIATDLSLNRPYAVVTRYNVGSGESTIWLNPASESDPSVSASDLPAPTPITRYAFRQASPMGALSVDAIRVGGSFTDVLIPGLQITATGSDIQVCWPAASDFTLEATSTLSAPNWMSITEGIMVEGDKRVVRFTNVSGTRFFRLVRSCETQ
jgi:hypothetical protein